MSYQLSITRRPTKSSLEGLPRVGTEHGIPLGDWLAVIESDQSFSFIVDEGDTVSALFQATDALEEIVWVDGRAHACQPSDQLVAKLMNLAQRLNAELVSSMLKDNDSPAEYGDSVVTFPHGATAHRMTIIP
ncbi:hypothetical protein [Arenicella xantha]|uniref:Uncharacterized protein n=1 Tax=Arenicella xantha TaxID=644221 RepID=A0A395JNK6_9GAMM|nr:hypothetical protein [Arenicella xantha]RBP53189.1 hypothetical protein DFR28_101574 [Arenicella xantha]